MSKYSRMAQKPVPQSEPLNERQVQNNAGGFVFAIDDWGRLDRFLILGSDAPTYYQTAKDLTKENTGCVERCWTVDSGRTADRIAEISNSGRAPKNDPAIYALAMGATHASQEARRAALATVPDVCRTSTHLFMFVDLCRVLGRGWGRSLKRAVARWYETKTAGDLAYQAVKYRAREGYTHKRLLQLSHPRVSLTPGILLPAKEALYRWICGKELDADRAQMLPAIVAGHLHAMNPETPKKNLIELIQDHRLPWEAIPTEATKDPEVWAAMLPTLGLTAVIRNLGKMTAHGALTPLSEAVATVVTRLSSQDEIRRSRVHPFQILQAMAVYKSGKGFRGSLSWQPVPSVVAALDRAFYMAFSNVKASGKRTLVALDVSGSMDSPLGDSCLRVHEAAAAMAMVTVRTEPNHHVMAFSQGFMELPITAADSLNDVMRKTSDLPHMGTDCALPMVWALRKKVPVDTFLIYTDNETWFGSVHPMEALRRYRAEMKIPAKMVVVGMTSTEFSIADPQDGGCLDCVGFDSSAPSLIADFARG
jgi:60 kDa SS-A/Ro ribonucleoprotein